MFSYRSRWLPVAVSHAFLHLWSRGSGIGLSLGLGLGLGLRLHGPLGVCVPVYIFFDVCDRANNAAVQTECQNIESKSLMDQSAGPPSRLISFPTKWKNIYQTSLKRNIFDTLGLG